MEFSIAIGARRGSQERMPSLVGVLADGELTASAKAIDKAATARSRPRSRAAT